MELSKCPGLTVAPACVHKSDKSRRETQEPMHRDGKMICNTAPASIVSPKASGLGHRDICQATRETVYCCSNKCDVRYSLEAMVIDLFTRDVDTKNNNRARLRKSPKKLKFASHGTTIVRDNGIDVVVDKDQTVGVMRSIDVAHQNVARIRAIGPMGLYIFTAIHNDIHIEH